MISVQKYIYSFLSLALPIILEPGRVETIPRKKIHTRTHTPREGNDKTMVIDYSSRHSFFRRSFKTYCVTTLTSVFDTVQPSDNCLNVKVSNQIRNRCVPSPR